LGSQHKGRLQMPACFTNSTLNRFVSHIKRRQNALQTLEGEFSVSKNDQELPDTNAQSQHLRATQTVIWIPRDCLGIGANESYHLRKYSDCLLVSNDSAYLDSYGKIILHGLPPI
jgi:hypothetical protein